MLAPTGIATDGAWPALVADNGTNAVSLFAANGSAPASSPVTGGGLNLPAAVAVDGQGVAWVANEQGAGSLLQLTVAGDAALRSHRRQVWGASTNPRPLRSTHLEASGPRMRATTASPYLWALLHPPPRRLRRLQVLEDECN